MTRDRLIDRIAKLLALANNNNSVEEAALAASRAQALMLEHEIDQATVELSDEPPELEDVVMDSIKLGKTRVSWKADLWYGIAEGNGCQGVTGPGGRGRLAKLYAFGRQSNVETCRYMYQWLVKEVDRLAKQALAERDCPDMGANRRYANSFRAGAAQVIARRLEDARAATFRQAEAQGKGCALVLVKNDMAVVKREAKDLQRKAWGGVATGSYSRGAVSSGAGYRDGKQAGGGVNLGSGSGQLGQGRKQIGE